MKWFFIIPFIIYSSIINAGYLIDGRCLSTFDNVFNEYMSEIYRQNLLPYNTSPYIFQDISVAGSSYNNITTVPASTPCTTVTGKPYCISGPYSLTSTGFTYYILNTKQRFKNIDSSGVITYTPYTPKNILIPECTSDPQSQLGLTPMNITMNPPPGYDAFLNPSIDWATTEWIFGSGLVLFALGAGIGSIINVTKKARV